MQFEKLYKRLFETSSPGNVFFENVKFNVLNKNMKITLMKNKQFFKNWRDDVLRNRRRSLNWVPKIH